MEMVTGQMVIVTLSLQPLRTNLWETGKKNDDLGCPVPDVHVEFSSLMRLSTILRNRIAPASMPRLMWRVRLVFMPL